MTATGADCTWFSESFPDLAEAYCLTMVRGVTPTELLRRLGASEESHATGVAPLLALGYQTWERHHGDRLLVAATPVDDWTLAVEPNGYLGVTEEVIIPLSHGTSLVSHFRNVNAHDQFYWIEDGDVRLFFEPLFPQDRDGSEPDGLVELMRQVGFDLDDDDDEDDEDGPDDLPEAAALALAEHLTGVRLTAELLESATYLCGVAPVPPVGR